MARKKKSDEAAEPAAPEHRDDEEMSYLEIAESRPQKTVVVTGRSITAPEAKPALRKRKGNFIVQSRHIWSPLPEEDKPKHPDDKPSRVTTIVKSEVLSPRPPYKKPPPSIGSMQPPGK